MMGAYILKIRFHLVAALKILIYKFLYGTRFKIGKRSTFRRNFSVYIENGRVLIGNRCFFNNFCSINSLQKVEIKDGCIFGENVRIYDHNHKFSKAALRLKEQGFSVGEVTIGENCWIGSNVTILKGAEIGNNCVIGAGCVIAQKIPPYSIVTSERSLKIEAINAD